MIRDRVPTAHLAGRPRKSLHDNTLSTILPSDTNKAIVREAFTRILCDTLADNVSSLSWMAKDVPRHKCSSYTRQKTECASFSLLSCRPCWMECKCCLIFPVLWKLKFLQQYVPVLCDKQNWFSGLLICLLIKGLPLIFLVVWKRPGLKSCTLSLSRIRGCCNLLYMYFYFILQVIICLSETVKQCRKVRQIMLKQKTDLNDLWWLYQTSTPWWTCLLLW